MEDLPRYQRISIHALLAESDPQPPTPWEKLYRFQSTLSLRRATLQVVGSGFSPDISIHALLAESDGCSGDCDAQSEHFNPRSPCGERLCPTMVTPLPLAFQSTLSLRRATAVRRGNGIHPLHFNPRSPCGERPDVLNWAGTSEDISIHALLAESDAYAEAGKDAAEVFQSTLSLRRATPLGAKVQHGLAISIHALLAESDGIVYPDGAGPSLFQSTLSLRRATGTDISGYLAESDFNPRSPCGERRGVGDGSHILSDFNPRSPCGERRV